MSSIASGLVESRPTTASGLTGSGRPIYGMDSHTPGRLRSRMLGDTHPAESSLGLEENMITRSGVGGRQLNQGSGVRRDGVCEAGAALSATAQSADSPVSNHLRGPGGHTCRMCELSMRECGVAKIPKLAVWLFLLAMAAFVFTLMFTYRWYEGSADVDRMLTPGGCNTKIIADGCVKLSKIAQANADRDLRYAMGGLVIAVAAAGGAVLVLKMQGRDQGDGYQTEVRPGHAESADARVRLTKLEQLRDDGLVSEDEYQTKRQQIVEEL